MYQNVSLYKMTLLGAYIIFVYNFGKNAVIEMWQEAMGVCEEKNIGSMGFGNALERNPRS